MWSKNVICFASRNLKYQKHKKMINLSNKLLSSQVQEAKSRVVKEYTETPKPAKDRVLKKFKDPFPKCFFVGKCDPEVLEYPEVVSLEEINNINELARKVKTFMSDEIDSKTIDATSSIPQTVLQKLAELGLYGVKLPIHYHGLGLTETEAAVISEATALDASISKLVSEQHNLSGAILKLYGTEEQKERYLSPLTRGKTIIACAYQENSSLADTETPTETIALPDGQGGFEITGKKMWVYNAPIADTFIVFANTSKKDDTGQRSQGLTAFIVEANSPGITVHQSITKFAIRGVPVSQVDFSDVRVSSNAVVGELHGGLAMIMIGVSGKLDNGAQVVGLCKHVFNHVTRHVIHTTFMNAPLSELEGVQARLGRLSVAIYALESAVFLLKGHADLYENPDTPLELFITKVLAAKTLQLVLNEAIQLIGVDVLAKEEFQYLDRFIRDSTFHAVCDETNLNLMTAVALKGLQHAGLAVHEEVRKVRNPLMFPMFVMRKLFEGNKRYGGNKGNDLGLAGYLHPSLQEPALALEYCISRIQMGSEMLLSRYGKEIIDKHMELDTLAEMTIVTYALTATLGRASRSYCIGLAESEAEMEMAFAMANYSRRKIHHLIELLAEGPISMNTTKYVNISERILANKGFFPQSPIARNF